MVMEADETLLHWHCMCGYNNVGYDPCAGCNRRAPRRGGGQNQGPPRQSQTGPGPPPPPPPNGGPGPRTRGGAAPLFRGPGGVFLVPPLSPPPPGGGGSP